MSVRHIAMMAALLLMSFGSAQAADEVRTHTFSTEDVRTLHIENAVGQIQVRTTEKPHIGVELRLTGQRSGWLRRKKDVSGVDLDISEQGSALTLSLQEKDVEAEWIVYMPALPQLWVELGVGKSDIQLSGTSLRLEVGVGSAQVSASDSSVGNIRAEVGVGDIEMTGVADYSTSRKVVAAEASGRGNGSDEIRIEVGVGDITLMLK